MALNGSNGIARINGNGSWSGFWQINLGHIITIAIFLLGAGSAFLFAKMQINAVDDRTQDYRVIRDQVLTNKAEITSLRGIATDNKETNKELLRMMTAIHANLASLNQKVEDGDGGQLQ